MAILSRLNKLRAMSAAEVLYRLRAWGRLAHERRRHRGRRPGAEERLRQAVDPRFGAHDGIADLLSRRRAAPPILPGARRLDDTRAVFGERFADEARDAARRAEQVRRHEVAFFGETFTFGPRIPWHRDPPTRAAWPEVFHADVPVNGGDRGLR